MTQEDPSSQKRWSSEPPVEDAEQRVLDGDESGVVGVGKAERARLLSGELQLDEWLDLQVERASAHLEGALGPSRLEAVRGVLRRQLVDDPYLAGLVERAARD